MPEKSKWVGDAVVFDLETTGLSPERDGIVEIGALRIRDGRVVTEDPYQTLVRPQNSLGESVTIPWRAERIHGISNEMVVAAPSIAQVLPEFLEWAGDAPLVAHNIGFDSGFMRAAARHCGLRWAPQREICTVQLSRRAFPRERRHNLDSLAGRLGLSFSPQGRHRSLGDVEVTAAAYLRLLELLDKG